MYVVARLLLSSVFIGLGAERILLAIFGQSNASAGTLAFSGFELAGGLAVAVGWQVRWIALLMALFLLVDAVLSHPFWSVPAAETHGQLLHFLKNVSATGGLVLLSWVEGQRVPQIDYMIGRRR
jgi:putative oxidoreductase